MLERTTPARPPQEVNAALHDLGHWEVRTGNYKRGLAVLSEFYRHLEGQKSVDDCMIQSACENLAAAYALSGNCAAARLWLPTNGEASVSAARSIVLARIRDFRAVLLLSYPELSRRQAELLGHSKRTFQLMRLFAQKNLDPDHSIPIDELRRAAPESGLEFHYLTKGWPELARFVHDHYGALHAASGFLPTAKIASD